MKLLTLIFVLALASFIAADYSNYKVFDVTPKREQIQELFKWEHQIGVDWWTKRGVGEPSRIMVSPDVLESFLQFLESNNIQHELFIDDVEPTLRRDKNTRLKSRAKRSVLAEENSPNFQLYWTFEEMEAYSIKLAQLYPNLVSRDVIGQSIEGRDIFGLRISSGAEFGKKPIIFIDSGVHAREWERVGPHSTLYLINQLVTNPEVTAELVDKVDWVIVPNVNPDGYVYTHLEDRLWRKNRRYVNYTCTGIDLNRNFRYVWRQVANSCPSSGYPGAGPLSEPEIFALAHYMESFKYNLRMYLSTHTCGNYVLWPYGFSLIDGQGLYIKNWREHELVGQRWVDVMAANGTNYRLGNSAEILYTAYGASDDHAAAYANANLVYTLELTCGGNAGFDYPQDMVFDKARQTFFGFREFGKYIGDTYTYDD